MYRRSLLDDGSGSDGTKARFLGLAGAKRWSLVSRLVINGGGGYTGCIDDRDDRVDMVDGVGAPSTTESLRNGGAGGIAIFWLRAPSSEPYGLCWRSVTEFTRAVS